MKRIKVKDYRTQRTSIDYARWRKSADYQKWRRLQYRKQSGLCYYCDVPLSGKKENVEHIMPRSKGGTNNWRNLVLSCWECNKSKGGKPLSRLETMRLEQKHLSKQIAYDLERDLGYELGQRFS